ncbi:MAG: DUF3482 domain-containing protein [Verrucomicrobiales bacterium]|nr:DUF3482 domain-containing protein [Verrucomicrobiales bacterium]
MPIVFSLISHTNAGKTTLLRTLLRQDVGEVEDRAHVTVEAKCYPLIEAPDGEALHLWDTPGFGSNLSKLASRIRQEANPIGWFLHQVWDRHRDASLYHSQTALRNVRDHADVVVYVIDVSQKPEQVGYIDAEMEILGLMKRPVIVALNQTGQPDPESARAREDEIRQLMQRHPVARHVVTLDAFTRCWVQEHRLLDLATGLLEDRGRRAAAARLVSAWRESQLAVFRDSAARLARLLAESATDSEALSQTNLLGRLRQLVDRKARDAEFDRLQQAMYERLRQRTEAALNDLITRHGIDGATARQFAETAREEFTATGGRVDEIIASIGGGAVSGLLGGVALDLASHGISFGSGAAIGAILGGATSYALARGYNLTQGDSQTVRWTEAHFRDEIRFCLLLYLAVAHFGRGRGRWQDAAEDPDHWSKIVAAVVDRHQDTVAGFWKRGRSESAATLADRYEKSVEIWLRECLTALYPESAAVFA